MTQVGHLRRQKGQTIALVAISMVGFVAVGALAIDLTSLYSARSEIQRAAEAVALAGAKAFVDSGVTTDPTRQSEALNLATAYANTAAAQNLVDGAPAQLAAGFPQFNFKLNGNPQITVELQQTNLPLFFSRMFGRTSASVSATAVAEAYNPSFSQSNTGGSFVPPAPKCVKPILLPNIAPNRNGVPSNTQFVTTTGQVTLPTKFINMQFDIRPACAPGPGCTVRGMPSATQYLPMAVTGGHQYCPAGAGCSPTSDYEKSVECCDGTVFNFPQVCGAKAAQVPWDPSIPANSPSSPVSSGLKCMVHFPQQDSLDKNAFLAGNGLLIDPGSFSQTRYGVASTSLVATSDSIITVPLFDSSGKKLTNPLTIVGFLTLFVKNPTLPSGPGRFSVTVLNVVGCGSASSAPPISGGGASSIPVRLIHN